VKKLRVAAKISDTSNPAGESWQGINRKGLDATDRLLYDENDRSLFAEGMG